MAYHDIVCGEPDRIAAIASVRDRAENFAGDSTAGAPALR